MALLQLSLGLVVGAVEGDHRLVDLELIFSLEAGNGVENVAIDRLNGSENALAAKPSLVAVAQLNRFARAGGSPRRNRGPSHRAVFQHDIHFDSWIPAAIQDFAPNDVHDRSHFRSTAAGIGLGLTASA